MTVKFMIAAAAIVLPLIQAGNAMFDKTEDLARETVQQVQEAADREYVDMGEFLITAYCPCPECSEEYGRETSTGKKAVEGRTVAVDPDVIAYGTRLLIGGSEYIAEDCGAMVRGDHIDIYMDDHDRVEAFGRKHMEVKIIR